MNHAKLASSGLITTLAGAADFNLKPSSPAIDAGIDVGLTRDYSGSIVPAGGAPDIGAYEFMSESPPPIPTSGSGLLRDKGGNFLKSSDGKIIVIQ